MRQLAGESYLKNRGAVRLVLGQVVPKRQRIDVDGLFGCASVIGIGFGLLFLDTPFLRVWLLSLTWNYRIIAYLPLVLWAQLGLLLVRHAVWIRHWKGDTVLVLLLVAFRFVTPVLQGNTVSLREMLGEAIQPAVLALCYFASLNGGVVVRRLLTRVIIGIAVVSLGASLLGSEELGLVKMQIAESGYFGTSIEILKETAKNFGSVKDQLLGLGLSGLSINRSFFGMLMSVALCLTFVPHRVSWPAIAAFIFIMFGLIGSKSRAPEIGAALGLILIVWILRRWHPRVQIVILRAMFNVALFGILAAMFLNVGGQAIRSRDVQEILSSINRFQFGEVNTQIENTDDTMIGQILKRVPAYIASLQLVIEHPLFGLRYDERNSYIYQRIDLGAETGHNLIQDAATLDGLPYTALFFVLLANALRGFAAGTRSVESVDMCVESAQLLGAYVAMLFFSLSHSPYFEWIFWILLAIGLAMRNSDSPFVSAA